MSQAEPSHDVHMGDNAHVGGSVNTGSIDTQGGPFIGGDQTVFILPTNDDLLNWFVEAAQRYRESGKTMDAEMGNSLATTAKLLKDGDCDAGIGTLDRIRHIMAACIVAKGPSLIRINVDKSHSVIPMMMGQAIWAALSAKAKTDDWELALAQLTSNELVEKLKGVLASKDTTSAAVERIMAEPAHVQACVRLMDDFSDPQRGLPILWHEITLRDGQQPSAITDHRTLLIAVIGGTASASLLIGGVALVIWLANVLQDYTQTSATSITPTSTRTVSQQDIATPPARAEDSHQNPIAGGGKQYSPAKLYFPSLNVQRPYIISLAELSAVRNLPPLIAQMEFCFVPEGNFSMGELQNAPDAWEADKPQHTVYVSSFYMARYPVTIEQFSVFVQMQHYQTEVEDTRNGYVYDGKEWKTDPEASWRKPRGRGSDIAHKSKHPVTLVSARDTDRFAGWLATLTDLPIRHPTEAEWEKAARGTDGRKYPWGPQLPTNQRCNFNMHERDTTSVGKYSPYGDSIYGCADMVGNVWERCADTYRSDIYTGRSNRVTRDPFHFSDKERRVLRGGAFDFDAQNVRCAGRDGGWDDVRYYPVGVRLAVSPISLHTSGR